MNYTKQFNTYVEMTAFIGQNLSKLLDLDYDEMTVTVKVFD
jgi:hypothetical protein